MSKRYCTHCGTPNIPTNETCSKCGKPLSSGLHQHASEKKPAKASRFDRRAQVEDDDDDWSGDITMPDSRDVIIQKPQKLTIGGLRDGAQIPSFAGEQLPSDIQVTSRAYFHDQKFD
jgi:hypothetical protein